MGGNPSTTSQTTIQEPSKFMKPYLGNLYSGAQSISRKKHIPFGGDRVSGFGQDELTAQSGIRDLYDAGDRPELDWGMGQTAGSTGLTSEAANVGRGIGQFDREAYNRYASPYMDDVIGIQKRNAMEEARQMQSLIGARQALQGGYGSMRHGVLESELMQGTQQNLSDIEAKGRQQSWENALAAHQSDQGIAIDKGGLMLDSSQAMRDAAAQSMDFADIKQNQAMDRIAALETSGMNQRDMEQAIKDMAYADFIEKRDWRQNQQSWLASILQGLPIPMSTVQTGSTPGPSIASQVGGAAALGIGGYNMYKNS